MLACLDAWVLRRPFEGGTARRYQRLARPAFGGLDEGVLAFLDADLRRARTFVDVGAGDGQFARLVAGRYPGVTVVGVEPSLTLTRMARFVECAMPTHPQPPPGVGRFSKTKTQTVRARAERLPLASSSVDAALFYTSLRHVADRDAALAEVRRVVRPGGAAYVVELDPEAPPARVARHRDALGSRLLRLTFAPLLLGTCPPAATFAQAARRAGWSVDGPRVPDPEQPFYLLRLT